MEASTAERHVKGEPAKDLVADNLFKAFEKSVAEQGDAVAIKDPARDVELTWNEVKSRASAIAGGLAGLGVGKGDTVALMLNNRAEFIPCDLGVVALGGVPFSIYQTSSPEQIQYVCSDAGAKVAIVETAFLEVFEKARADLPELEHVIVVDGDGGTHTLQEIESADPGFDSSAAAESVTPDDLLTLIYTSGTTGPPKGVQLTHRNLMGLVSGMDDVIPVPEDGGRIISWLPAAHIAERGANYYLPVILGLEITVCPDPRKVVEFLPQVRPTFFFAVPRIWEKLKAGIEAKLSNLPEDQRGLAEQGLQAAIQKVKLEQSGQEVPEQLAAGVAAADEQLFSKLRAQLGLDAVTSVNVGAAPTPLEVLEFFHAIGIPIGELWGMSETCGVVTINRPGEVKLGTVGTCIPGFEVKLAEDGEVLTRGIGIMQGYRNLPDKTAETILDDGWLLTGDIGELDEDGYLRIVDRKKELIINAAGKNMSPANIESKVKAASPLIGQAIAIGDRRPYNTALVVLDPDYAPAWASQNGLEGKGIDELASEDKAREAVQAAIDEANEKMSRVEQIKKFTILPAEWMPGGDELTPTMKLKRKPIAEKYSDEIEALYS